MRLIGLAGADGVGESVTLHRPPKFMNECKRALFLAGSRAVAHHIG